MPPGGAADCRRAARFMASPLAVNSLWAAVTQFAHHHQPAVDTGAQLHSCGRRQVCHSCLSIQGSPDGVFGVILAGLLCPEESQQPITQVLGDAAVVSGDCLCQGGMEPGHHLAPLFGVQFFRQAGRADHVDEKDRDHAALFDWSRLSCSLLFQHSQLLPQSCQGWIDNRIPQLAALRLEPVE